MPLTSATASSTTTIAMWFVEQVHLLRVYCTDTIPLTYGSLLKKNSKQLQKAESNFWAIHYDGNKLVKLVL